MNNLKKISSLIISSIVTTEALWQPLSNQKESWMWSQALRSSLSFSLDAALASSFSSEFRCVLLCLQSHVAKENKVANVSLRERWHGKPGRALCVAFARMQTREGRGPQMFTASSCVHPVHKDVVMGANVAGDHSSAFSCFTNPPSPPPSRISRKDTAPGHWWRVVQDGG